MKNTLKKLQVGQKGFSAHFLIPLIVIVLVAGIGVWLLLKSHAEEIASYQVATTCSGPVNETPGNVSKLMSDASRGGELCLAPGTYRLSVQLALAHGTRLIGSSPTNRPVIDASNVSTALHKKANGIQSGGGAVIANVAVTGARTTGQKNGSCPDCGYGINAGANDYIYNVYAFGNMENGIHAVNYITVKNSTISNNGYSADVGWSSGGLKTTAAGVFDHNIISNNLGPGLWCDYTCSGGVWSATNNTVIGNSHGGIRYETSGGGLSDSAIITGNKVSGNNTDNTPVNGGIEIVDSADALVQSNVINGNHKWGFFAKFDGGGRKGAVQLRNIKFLSNTGGDPNYGCDGSAVICK